jgi:integrase
MIRKLYRERVPLRWKIIEKETIDEIIFRTTKVRNRLILELMARGGMRIGEVLKLQLGDLQDRKLVLREPKSGKEYEFVFIPQKVADRYVNTRCRCAMNPDDRIFPISYEVTTGASMRASRGLSWRLSMTMYQPPAVFAGASASNGFCSGVKSASPVPGIISKPRSKCTSIVLRSS